MKTAAHRKAFLAAAELHHQLAEDVLEAAEELLAARQRPREGWHNSHRSKAESRYFHALNEYAAVLAVNADPDVWQDAISRAQQQIAVRIK
jgi:hypothetical protein